VPCGVSIFETRQLGTLCSSLPFCWQRGAFVSEWSWQEKRKRALLESNPPGIFCRRLIPMSAGEEDFGSPLRISVFKFIAMPLGSFGS
jgi:hypothetical protein